MHLHDSLEVKLLVGSNEANRKKDTKNKTEKNIEKSKRKMSEQVIIILSYKIE